MRGYTMPQQHAKRDGFLCWRVCIFNHILIAASNILYLCIVLIVCFLSFRSLKFGEAKLETCGSLKNVIAIDIVRSDNENPTHDRDRKEILEAFVTAANKMKIT